MILTPNLTAIQQARLLDALSRLTKLLCAPVMYADADLVAGRWMLEPHKEHAPAADTAAELAHAFDAPLAIAGYIAGLALGVRLGRTFARAPRLPRKTISDEYHRLDTDQRREVHRMIRVLSDGRAVFTFTSYDPAKAEPVEGDVTAARRWTREAGRLARGQR